MNVEHQMMSTLPQAIEINSRLSFSQSRRAHREGNSLVGFAHAMGINTVFYGFQDYRVAGIYFWDVPAVQAPVSVET